MPNRSTDSIFFKVKKTVEYFYRDQIDLYPPPTDFSRLEEICIGTKSHNLGDALILTSLPKGLKERYPNLRKIRVYIKGFNPCVFENNPDVDGVAIFPKAVYGDDINFDSGHLIQLKEHYFDIPESDHPRPCIFLNQEEKIFAERFFENATRPICILHPVGKTHALGLDRSFFDAFVEAWREKVEFCQVGIQGDSRIKGCEHYALGGRGHGPTRELFALIDRADFLIGANSAPMHIAAAFQKKSLIFTLQGSIEEIFKKRKTVPYYLQGNLADLFLYEDNDHVPVDRLDVGTIRERVDHFLTQALEQVEQPKQSQQVG